MWHEILKIVAQIHTNRTLMFGKRKISKTAFIGAGEMYVIILINQNLVILL